MGDEASGDGCSTAVVRALADQLVDELNCLHPGTLVTFEEGDQIQFQSDAVIPALQPDARQGLMAALEERPGQVLTIQSALRSLPQQYLLHEWWQRGRCGIQIAASPGRSNHEGGLAIDIDDYAAWRNALEDHGWEWYGDGDRVHFTYHAGEEIRAASVLGFQILWNTNHPGDQIDEDGVYGPETEARLTRAPVGGFAIGSTCRECEQGLHARFDGVVAPNEAVSGEEVNIEATFTNTGDETWVAGRVTLSTDPPVALDRDIIAGDSETFGLTWTAPAAGQRWIRLELEDSSGTPIPAGCEGAALHRLRITVSEAPEGSEPQEPEPDSTGVDGGDPGTEDAGAPDSGLDSDEGSAVKPQGLGSGCSGAASGSRASGESALLLFAILLGRRRHCHFFR